MVFTCISLILMTPKYLFMCLLPICTLLEKCLFQILSPFFLLIIITDFFTYFRFKALIRWFINIFSILWVDSILCSTKVLNFDEAQCIHFFHHLCIRCCTSGFAYCRPQRFTTFFFYHCFIVFVLTFGSRVCLEAASAYWSRKAAHLPPSARGQPAFPAALHHSVLFTLLQKCYPFNETTVGLVDSGN